MLLLYCRVNVDPSSYNSLTIQDNMAAKSDSENCSESGSTNQLDVFLKEIAETEAKFPDDQNAQIIRSELDDIIQETVLDLSAKYRLFHNATIQKGGSMVDGTKIGQPDEFDYVLVLPALQEQLVTTKDGEPFYANSYDIIMQSTKLPLGMKDLAFMDDVLCPEWCDENENKDMKSRHLIFKDGKSPWRDEIASMVSVAIHRSLDASLGKYQKWQYVARLKCPSGKTYLQILKFSCDSFETFVSVDICLAIRIPYTSADQDPLQLLFEFWSINAVSCTRRSESTWETTAVSSLAVDSVEKQCYRVVKYLIQTFLESYFDMYTMSYKMVIETYTLKTMFLKVLVESESKWESHQLGAKVLEILGLIKQDLSTVVKRTTCNSSSDPLHFAHPLRVSMDYCLHPVSAEPALFPRSKLTSTKADREAIFQRPSAIKDQVSTLVDLLLMVRDTEEGREHFLSQIESIEKLRVRLKNGTYQIPIMEALQERSTASGVYNNFLLIWHVLHRNDFKSYMRKTKFGIVVQPEGKDDDCVVFPKTLPLLRFLNCRLFDEGGQKLDENGTEILEMDVFEHAEHNQVVCWNVNESVDLKVIIQEELCSFCATSG